MSKKLILLIIIFFVVLSSLIYIKYFYELEQTIQIKSRPQQSVHNDAASASIYVAPSSLIATSSAISSIQINLDTTSRPTSIQLEIGYNPGDIYNISIIPGSYFINPEIPLEKIDFKNGRISYVLTDNEINPNSNLIATIDFTPINYGPQKITKFEFLPKTSIKENSKIIDISEMIGSTITIKPSFFIPFATPSAVLQQ